MPERGGSVKPGRGCDREEGSERRKEKKVMRGIKG